jgi:hypothetical protein
LLTGLFKPTIAMLTNYNFIFYLFIFWDEKVFISWWSLYSLLTDWNLKLISVPIIHTHTHTHTHFLLSKCIVIVLGAQEYSDQVHFSAGICVVSSCHRVETGSGAYPASYPTSTWNSFPWCEADHTPLLSSEVKNAWS